MKRRLWKFSTATAFAFAFVLCGQASASAQARPVGGAPPVSGRTSRVEQGMGRTIDVSMGRSGNGMNMGDPTRPNAPNRAPYEFAEQARLREMNRRNADKELRNHPDMPARLHTTADILRDGYRQAIFYNPILTFNEYLVVTRLAARLAATHPNITRTGLLNGLAARKSIERTLRDRGLGKEEAKEALSLVKREIKKSREP